MIRSLLTSLFSPMLFAGVLHAQAPGAATRASDASVPSSIPAPTPVPANPHPALVQVRRRGRIAARAAHGRFDLDGLHDDGARAPCRDAPTCITRSKIAATPARGLRRMDVWLGAGKWDVIYFNFGLHDMKYLDAQGKYVPPDQGTQLNPPPVYEANLRELVARLRRTGRDTRVLPRPRRCRTARSVAWSTMRSLITKSPLRVMKELGVARWTTSTRSSVARQKEIQLPQNVHFTDRRVTPRSASTWPRRWARFSRPRGLEIFSFAARGWVSPR